GFVFNSLYGDGQMLDSTQGGDDVVTGGSNTGSGYVTNFLYGDGAQVSSTAKSGDDKLISGTNATDDMWGDWAVDEAANVPNAGSTGGSDTFVLLANNGQ